MRHIISSCLQGPQCKQHTEGPLRREHDFGSLKPGDATGQQEFGIRQETSCGQTIQPSASGGSGRDQTAATGPQQAAGEPAPGQQERQKSRTPPSPKQRDHALTAAKTAAGYLAAAGLLTLLIEAGGRHSGMDLNLAESALLACFTIVCMVDFILPTIGIAILAATIPVMAVVLLTQGLWLLLARCARVLSNVFKRR